MFVGNQCLHKQSYNGIGNSKEWVIPKSYGIVDKTNDRYLRERQVACVFVTKGYGMRVTREVLRSLNGTDLNNNEYNNLINGVVRSVYRKL